MEHTSKLSAARSSQTTVFLFFFEQRGHSQESLFETPCTGQPEPWLSWLPRTFHLFSGLVRGGALACSATPSFRSKNVSRFPALAPDFVQETTLLTCKVVFFFRRRSDMQ